MLCGPRKVLVNHLCEKGVSAMAKKKAKRVRICRPYITTRSGKRIYAHQYGLTAFCFYVDREK